MKLKHHLLTTTLIVSAILSFAPTLQAEDKKVDPTGTWTWTTPSRDGSGVRTNNLHLKLEGEKLSGDMSSRDGQVRPIEDPKLKDDQISFKATREYGGNKFVIKYNGKVSGDSIKGTSEFLRDGETQSRDWEATRVKVVDKAADKK
jgi:hypothetical protein